MREIIELRVQEEYARIYLRPDEGRVLGDPEINRIVGPSVRLLFLNTSDPRYREIEAITKRIWSEENKYFFHGWDIRRQYTRQELAAATAFKLEITACFEPVGEACGTEYDDASACQMCGAGRLQTSDLRLDLRKAPKNKDIARTIADEWIISQRLAELLVDSGMTGFELKSVRHKARYADDPYILSNYPSGRELLKLAERLDLRPPEWSFYVWLNRHEQSYLLGHVQTEVIADKERKSQNRTTTLPVWHHLIVTADRVQVAPKTVFGLAPFEEDVRENYRCPLGHVLGLNLLSELHITRYSWDGSDISVTQQLVGCRRGVLVPRPMIIISPRLYRLLHEHKIRGHKIEVAHLE